MATITQIQEYTAAAPRSVNRAAGIIRDVKILGLQSSNGRQYPRATLAKAAPLYEGAKVNVDHATGPDEHRSYRDRIGSIRGVRLAADGLRGDLRANPRSAIFEQLAWDAEHSPESVGLSHNVIGKTVRRNGAEIVEEITQVLSVDLVTEPATTAGLFESTGGSRTLTEAERNHVVDVLRRAGFGSNVVDVMTGGNVPLSDASLLVGAAAVRRALNPGGSRYFASNAPNWPIDGETFAAAVLGGPSKAEVKTFVQAVSQLQR